MSPLPKDQLTHSQVPSALYSEVAVALRCMAQRRTGLVCDRRKRGRGAQARRTLGTETPGLWSADLTGGGQVYGWGVGGRWRDWGRAVLGEGCGGASQWVIARLLGCHGDRVGEKTRRSRGAGLRSFENN